MFALVPDALIHSSHGFAFYRSEDRKLSPQLRDLGQARAGFAAGSQFVFSQHCKGARYAGLSEEQITAIPAWQTAGCFDDAESARCSPEQIVWCSTMAARPMERSPRSRRICRTRKFSS